MALSLDDIKDNYDRYRQHFAERDSRMEAVLPGLGGAALLTHTRPRRTRRVRFFAANLCQHRARGVGSWARGVLVAPAPRA